MENMFITGIYIDKVRHLEDIDIKISDIRRKHLILTGKNGSGKTSLLMAMRDDILREQYEESLQEEGQQNYSIWHHHRTQLDNIDDPGVKIHYSAPAISLYNTVFVYISATREQLIVPKAIEPVDIKGKTVIERNAGKEFLKYILALDYRLYGAKSNGNTGLEKNLTKWFENFVKALRNIYNCEALELQRDTKNLSFMINMPDREPFALHQMSDGYAAFLHIIMELLIRLEDADAVVDYQKSAVVMIDEMEAHLHVELQKRALPFLTQMFPNVQFIVTTHSPFVMTSLEDAVVYDLEKNERLEKPSFYSYDTVVESFLDTSMYSGELQRYFARYKELCFRERTLEEKKEFLRAKAELEIRAIPSTELYIAFQQLENQRKAAENGTSE